MPDLARKATVTVTSALPKQTLDFRFIYAYPHIDIIFAMIGALVGFAANKYVVNPHAELLWYWSFLSSMIGSLSMFVLGVFALLNNIALTPTWLTVALLTISGGIHGTSATEFFVKLVTKFNAA